MSPRFDDNLQIVKTADGSNTIYNPQAGENYHSKHGALQESRHVFVNSGLRYFLQRKQTDTGPKPESVSILEVGFGTGLNFLLSAEACSSEEISLCYTGIEAYPLNPGLIAQTGYEQYVPAHLWQSFIDNYKAALISEAMINAGCWLEVTCTKLMGFVSDRQYDVIYFDAFASLRQPEMWSYEAIAHTISFLRPGGVFVTYAITGELKRTLKALNCKVEKALGAPGKREMLRAVKLR